MKTVTISLDEEVARWARMRAAARKTSLSQLVEAMLRDQMITEEGYRAAREQFFSSPSSPDEAARTGAPNPGRALLCCRSSLTPTSHTARASTASW